MRSKLPREKRLRIIESILQPKPSTLEGFTEKPKTRTTKTLKKTSESSNKLISRTDPKNIYFDVIIEREEEIKERIRDFYKLHGNSSSDPWTESLMSVSVELFNNETYGDLADSVSILGEVLTADCSFLNDLVN